MIVLCAAGTEETPTAVSHRDQGRVVYVYEPTLGNFVRTLFCLSTILLWFLLGTRRNG